MRKTNVIRSTAVVSACTGLSRVLGFVREILMAVLFGTSLAKTAFDVAFRIPNLFRRLFGEGALSAAFVPVFTETVEKDGLEEANRLAGKAFTLLGATLLGVAALGILAASAAIAWLPLGPKAAAVLPLLRIMLPYMVFICLVALCMGILNSLHHFAVPAVTPVLLNVVWIAMLVLVCPRLGSLPGQQIYGAAWGIIVAGVVQLAAQIPALAHFGIRPRLSFAWRDARVRRILLLMGPAAIGMGVHQINVVIDGLLALAVGTWAPAALTYAERLIYLPLGILATALGTVLLPTFSRQAAQDQIGKIPATLGSALRNLMFVMIPAAVGLAVLATPIVRLAFVWQGGRFDATSTVRTVRALVFYAPGLVAFSVYKILVPAFYALKDTVTPVRIGIRVVGLNLLLNIAFILTWPTEFKHAGLALATVLASVVNSVVLGRILQRRIGSPGWGCIATSATRVLTASAVMAGVVIACRRAAEQAAAGWELGMKSGHLLVVVLCMAGGILAYAASAALICRPEIRALRNAYGRK